MVYAALQDTTDATVLLDDVVMNPFTPISTSDDVNVAHIRSREDLAINTIHHTDDPVLRQLLHAEAPVLDSILLYIKDMTPHSNTCIREPTQRLAMVSHRMDVGTIFATTIAITHDNIPSPRLDYETPCSLREDRS